MLALAAAPWSHPLSFRPAVGWHTGSSGNTKSVYIGHGKWTTESLESAAWIARGVRYRDPATADPPNQTLRMIPRGGLIVWAVIYGPLNPTDQPIQLDLQKAKRYACCEEAPIPAEFELTGAGPHHAYSVIARIYFGSKPNARSRAAAQVALRQIDLPAAR